MTQLKLDMTEFSSLYLPRPQGGGLWVSGGWGSELGLALFGSPAFIIMSCFLFVFFVLFGPCVHQVHHVFLVCVPLIWHAGGPRRRGGPANGLLLCFLR